MQRPCGGTKSRILPLSYANAVCCRCIIYDFGRAGGTLNQLLQAGRNIISDTTWCVFHYSVQIPTGCHRPVAKRRVSFVTHQLGYTFFALQYTSTGIPSRSHIRMVCLVLSKTLKNSTNLRVVFLTSLRSNLTRVFLVNAKWWQIVTILTNYKLNNLYLKINI